MDRGPWWATGHGVYKVMDATEHTQTVTAAAVPCWRRIYL